MRAAGMLDNSGRFTLVVALNGSSSTGKPLGSGVYMIRLVLWQNMAGEGELPDNRVVNQVFKFGWEIPLK
jgi:hypothetical protein